MKQEVARKSTRKSENAQDLFTYLPSEIILNILLRIPTRTIMSCKCVCKSWRDLIETREFVNSHLSISVPGLAVYMKGKNSKRYRIVDFVDVHRPKIVFDFSLPFDKEVHTSVNGLLFLFNDGFREPRDFFICNPITREYIKLPPPLPHFKPISHELETHGFGVSKMSGQYKVVTIFKNRSECQVYTIGTGSWRRIALDVLLYWGQTVGAFLNGNLHWLASLCFSDRISCFDLETELFSTFSPPPRLGYNTRMEKLSVLGDCLCVCDTSINYNMQHEIYIWLMKVYGDEKSWTRVFFIKCYDDVGKFSGYPIKVLKDGDILIEWGNCKLLYYSSSKAETIRKGYLSKGDWNFTSSTTIYTPSFLPLKTFVMENVSSF